MTTKKNKLLKRFALMFLMLLGTYLQAQEKNVSGTVTSSEDGISIPGVNILLKGTTTGTSTDFDGVFNIQVPGKDAVLQFSYLGYVTKEVVVGDNSNLSVVLQVDENELEEIVVIGYGTVKKSDVSGSVSSVKAAELTAYPTLSAEQALQGRAAGVSVQSNNGGEPGAPIKVRIRGGTSINASSDALIVVDGFVGASMPAPEDIASMEVLKDASATAIYGSRGSNGVIMVTTKKGTSTKPTLELNTSYSVQNVNNTIDLLDANEFATYRKAYSANYNQGPANTDWQDLIYATGSISNTQLAFSGGSETSKYYISGNYYTQDGVVMNSNLERFTVLSNIDIDVTDNFKVGLNVFGGRSAKDGVSTQAQTGGTGGGDVISSAYRFAPDLDIYNADGTYTINSLGDDIDNPYALAKESIDERSVDTYRTNFYAAYEIIEGLELKTTFGFSSVNTQIGKFKPTTLLAGAGVGGEATLENRRSTNVLSENYLTYKKTVGNHNFTLLGGYSYQKNKNEGSLAGARSFVTNEVSYRNLEGGAVTMQPSSFLDETELISVFGRVNYEYASKYIFTFTARRDGSSNFSKNNKYAFFPSGAIAWNMGNENFLKDSNVISNWKWRASYGATGNPSISPYETLAKFSSVYGVVGDQQVNSVVLTDFANDNLKWETSKQLDLGVDVALFNNRLELTFDYYNIQTEDLLFPRPLPEYSGVSSQIQNIGELKNEGYEFSLNSRNIANEDFTWSTAFNFSTNKNEMVTLPDGDDLFIDSAPGHFLQRQTQVLREGESVGSFYGYEYKGVYQGGTLPDGTATLSSDSAPGGELFADLNNDGEITTADRKIIGDPTPDFTMGLNNDFRYKNFDMNLFFQASVGGEILNYTLLELGSGVSNASADMVNAWSTTNTDTNIPRPEVREKRITSRYVYDGSYVRLKNLSFGYNIPGTVLSKLSLEKARIYISGQNLLTFTDYPGADPEANYRNDNNQRSNTNVGLDYGSYPNVKTFTMGLNLKF
ncbi:SusC/RagA family TonB-linked outer membrane protein [Pseudotamlana carrageenivorans]|uniref:SusC/RagA family protein n=1 Tax=Pseudotamlana carrageenivorans TaxID=2069432 RepID=A0A2I7SKB5_9FLAO|nr:TonB-dependent receptor [Tamlana carrageenivorans]AUS06333.1 SusC/RagA family protein [Tamlana carrageenivorans]